MRRAERDGKSKVGTAISEFKPSWKPTREAGLERLESFLPLAGHEYARERNHDRGPGDRGNVSGLSPYIRHRLVSESEVVEAVIAAHGPEAGSKFIQEVCWRTYWKGWLELRPRVWDRYQGQVREDLDRLARSTTLRSEYEAAVAGRTGLACFDAWARELVETGYLHNHARMWFASIWIFTLKLPWSLGADFFLRYLMDGDPASNTLSWRWVAGLQTRGKTYLARADNIATYTNGRFQPRPGELAEEAQAVEEPGPEAPGKLAAAGRVEPGAQFGLLLTEEDLQAEGFGPPILAGRVRGCLGSWPRGIVHRLAWGRMRGRSPRGGWKMAWPVRERRYRWTRLAWRRGRIGRRGCGTGRWDWGLRCW